jgi:hypothetical protein
MKLTRLTQKQTITPQKHNSLYPRVINNTNMTFSDKDNTLLVKEKQDCIRHSSYMQSVSI